MPTAEYVAFLRAVNVGGRAVVLMTDVRDAFARAGAQNVRTVIQSGNVLFAAAPREVAGILDRAGHRLGALAGERPAIALRTVGEVSRLVDDSPFAALPDTTGAKLYVAFLADRPRRAPVFPLVSAKEALEAIGLRDRDVFIVSRRKPNGMFGFPNNFVEEQLNIGATTRNWTTVTRIAGLVRASSTIGATSRRRR